jgi:hypothetical protein
MKRTEVQALENIIRIKIKSMIDTNPFQIKSHFSSLEDITHEIDHV